MSTPFEKLSPVPEPKVIGRAEHGLSRSRIDPDALKVLYRLHRQGHIAYLVGGGVRDLLLGNQPKDFDISTSAHPNEVRKLFSNCRLIGRRFRLAHIYFKGGKIIEVSTFRTISDFSTEDGRITSDNTFGTPGEDAFRRDFTVNALFYNIADFSIIDYMGGLEDLKKGVVRCIGDPKLRFLEDPIRMLRGVRFAALLDFSLDPESDRLIRSKGEMIWEGAVPRILEEIVRMMGRGTAARAMERLVDSGLISHLFPQIDQHIRMEGIEPYTSILSRMDKRFRAGQTLEPWLIMSCLFYPLFEFVHRGSPGEDHAGLARDTISPACKRIQVPRKVQDLARQVLAAQPRLFGLKDGRFKPRTILRKAYFEDAFTLFAIAAAGDDKGRDLIREWEELRGEKPRSDNPRSAGDRKPQGLRQGQRPKPRRRRRRGPRTGRPPGHPKISE
ncbi:MAG: polynucleotide adenylyltransferase PcnB [bacterium]|nr:polynucleotide adenylyltransferase PcnB [bacterium]MDT8394829.1 polynucleotide adenylyltransferase PcnB [bacterium]